MADPLAALDAMGQLPDAELDLAIAALQFARADLPGADWQATRAYLSALAREAAVLPAAGLAERAEALADLLARQHGYQGDAETYDDLANANLIQVVERRRGLPVALGILWIHAARAAGWEAHGLDFPGHFLVGLAASGKQAVVDPFSGGGLLGPPALGALLKRIEGPGAELRPDMLSPVGNRLILLRLQNNIKLRRLLAGELGSALDCTERMLRLAPAAATLWREAALMQERLGQVTAALAAWRRFLVLVPDGDLAAQAQKAMAALSAQLN
jgi:regulator of sirC expression with transglutaminase-like and TPR domain